MHDNRERQAYQTHLGPALRLALLPELSNCNPALSIGVREFGQNPLTELFEINDGHQILEDLISPRQIFRSERAT